MQLNVHGCLADKLELSDFVNTLKQYDIILLNECWISDESIIDLGGYVCIKKIRPKKKRAKRYSGGLVCYIKESLYKGVHTVNFDFEDGMCLRLNGIFLVGISIVI